MMTVIMPSGQWSCREQKERSSLGEHDMLLLVTPGWPHKEKGQSSLVSSQWNQRPWQLRLRQLSDLGKEQSNDAAVFLGRVNDNNTAETHWFPVCSPLPVTFSYGKYPLDWWVGWLWNQLSCCPQITGEYLQLIVCDIWRCKALFILIGLPMEQRMLSYYYGFVGLFLAITVNPYLINVINKYGRKTLGTNRPWHHLISSCVPASWMNVVCGN